MHDVLTLGAVLIAALAAVECDCDHLCSAQRKKIAPRHHDQKGVAAKERRR